MNWHRPATALKANCAATLQAYQARRRARVGRARSRGAFNQFAYHARGPIRLGRIWFWHCGSRKASPPSSTGSTATEPPAAVTKPV
jgi:hypothetical protein